MKGYLVLLFICVCTLGYAQSLTLEKASPFTAVRWDGDIPIVRMEGKWYTLEQLGSHPAEALAAFCKAQYGSKWQKRFSEDLVEVLKTMGDSPNVEVNVMLSNKKETKTYVGVYTYENRKKVVLYNRAVNDTFKSVKTLTTMQAIADIDEFERTLEVGSSYIHLSDYDYKKALLLLKTAIEQNGNTVDVDYLTHALAQIMAEVGDRHSSVKNEGFDMQAVPSYKLQLPFAVATLNDNVVALKPQEAVGEYTYLFKKYPYVKSINNMAIARFIDSLAYRSKKAPKAIRYDIGVLEIGQIGRLYFKNNLALPKQTKVVFTDMKRDTTVFVKLTNKDQQYLSKLTYETRQASKAIEQGNFDNISRILKDDIGYIKIPRMFSFDHVAHLKAHMDSVFFSFKNTKSLIIDLRDNPGGTRDLIALVADYIIPKQVSPWVANIAYLRTDIKDSVYDSMTNRFLNTLETYGAAEKESIRMFNNDFDIQQPFDKSLFSKPHYMVLESGNTLYSKPVYILVNGQSFSAATVFTSAFCGLPNVKIVGETTDGSSGNSRKMHLKHSHIRVKYSTMISLQRNGKTLDGYGTKPDITIKPNEKQVLGKEDYQLQTLMAIINP